jgi:haloacetate dehalogenase
MESLFDVVDTWKEKADNVIGKSLPCGHFIPEEAPDELLSEIVPFLINQK